MTGYQGGELNQQGGYIAVRQMDAHAWVEYWQEGRGWISVDPTFQVAPERIELGADEALAGADFVFSAMRTGGTAGRVLDERIAAQHGVIGQETVGAGGISYALRSIPASLRLARTVDEVAPGAWLINFTNPAGMVTEALSAVHPRVVGICDSPIALARRAIDALALDPARTQIDYVESPEVVSMDFVGSNRAGIVDGLATIATGDSAVVYVWYDNEYGYSCQVVRMVQKMAGVELPSLPL